MRSKTLLIMTLVLCLALSASAMAQTQITFWHAMSGELGNAIDHLTAEFNAQNPDIVVESIYQGRYGDLNTKLVASLSARTTPTIAQVYENWTDAFFRHGVLVPLSHYMDLSEAEFNDYVEVFRGMNTWDGELYTIPYNKSNWVLFYHADMIPNPPQTVEEFLQISKDIAAQTNGATKGFGIRPTLELFHAFLYVGGGDFLDQDLNVTFNSPEGKAALELMIGMLDDGSALLIDGYENEAFGDQMIAMYIGSSAGMPHVENSVGDKFQFSTAPIPAGVRPGAPFMGTNIALFASATEEERAAAGKFVKFLTNTENTVYFAIKTGYLPVTYSGLNSPEYQQFLQDNPHKAAVANLDAFEYGYWQPTIAAWEEARNAIGTAVERVFLGEPMDLVLDEAQMLVEEAIDEMLSQRY
ncbi:MAG: ABC transporter substrate-binding protein [Firmicutes bacterium]|nr:ABC transporter substrate-binding protein [Bacillota bacterium]